MVDPLQATSIQQQSMKFFLNIALASVDPNVGKKSLGKTGLTHMIAFGDLWPAEVATAMLLVKYWSDTTNLAHNISIATDNEKKKKRKPVHDKQTRSTIEYVDYYDLEERMQKIYKLPGLEARMMAWDDYCCGGRGRKRTRGAADRVNTVPSEHRKGPDSSRFLGFVKRNKRFENICHPMPPLQGATLKMELDSTQSNNLNIHTVALANGDSMEVSKV